jgi:hypothetical protein
MASFPRKKGGTIGRRNFFSGLGSSDAGKPGKKTELRQAKHRVATAQCSGTNASGGRCGLKTGHGGYHRNVRDNTVMQTYGSKSKSGRYTPRG